MFLHGQKGVGEKIFNPTLKGTWLNVCEHQEITSEDNNVKDKSV